MFRWTVPALVAEACDDERRDVEKGFRQQLEQPTPDEAVVRRAQRFEQRIVAIERQAGQQIVQPRKIHLRAGEHALDRLGPAHHAEDDFRRGLGPGRWRGEQIEQHVELSGVNRLIDRSFEQRSERTCLEADLHDAKRVGFFPHNPVRPLAID